MVISAAALEKTPLVNVVTDRVKQRKEECNKAPRKILFGRAKSITASWKETEAESNRLRWGKAFARVLEESAIVIRDGELIVGCETKDVRGAEIVPECNPYDVLEQLDSKKGRMMSEVMLATIDPDEEGIRAVANFWIGKSVNDIVYRALETKMGPRYMDYLDGRKGKVAVLPDVNGTVYKTQTIFSPKVMKGGLRDLIKRAKAEKEKTINESKFVQNNYTSIFHKTVILDVMVIVCEALIKYSKRHAELARKMAESETNSTRKQELLEIAERCDWVPENEPRNFREALQYYWFIHMGIRKEAPYHSGPCPERIDQWAFPYYEKDIKEGTLTRQDAAEFLGLLWVKLNELQNVSGSYFEKEAAGSLLQQVTLGGTKIDGQDATNDLSFLILEVARQIKMPQPGIYIRWHNNIDHNFMIKAIETNRDTRGGIPAFLNDRIAIRNLTASGYSYDDAVEWSAAGCLSYVVSHCNLASKIAAYVIVPKVLEIALFNGTDPRTGMKIGIETGDVTKFTSMDQIYEAFWKNYDHFVDVGAKEYWVAYSSKVEHLGTPFTSLIIEDCMKKGLDVYEGGERYPEMGVCFGQRGCVDVADAFAAIKKLVFDDKKITMTQLMEAMKANWVGHEDLLQMCLKAPKYGNDDDYVDDIFNYVSKKCNDIILTKPNPCTGRAWRVSRPALTGHYPAGEVTGALPNGRKAKTPLYDAGLSPMVGADVYGPTALIKSATKADQLMPYMDSMVLNMKFTPAMIQNNPSIEKVLAVLKTFFDRNGWHVQFNITSREDLLEAKKHPEQWKSLIVRVAGYSAYFVDLPPAVQDEIISRTEHGI
jgi:trans-4-hydroxy-L-proline dehydratase